MFLKFHILISRDIIFCNFSKQNSEREYFLFPNNCIWILLKMPIFIRAIWSLETASFWQKSKSRMSWNFKKTRMKESHLVPLQESIFLCAFLLGTFISLCLFLYRKSLIFPYVPILKKILFHSSISIYKNSTLSTYFCIEKY